MRHSQLAACMQARIVQGDSGISSTEQAHAAACSVLQLSSDILQERSALTGHRFANIPPAAAMCKMKKRNYLDLQNSKAVQVVCNVLAQDFSKTMACVYASHAVYRAKKSKLPCLTPYTAAVQGSRVLGFGNKP